MRCYASIEIFTPVGALNAAEMTFTEKSAFKTLTENWDLLNSIYKKSLLRTSLFPLSLNNNKVVIGAFLESAFSLEY